MTTLGVGDPQVTHHNTELGLHCVETLCQVAGDISLNIVETVVGGEVEELLLRHMLIIDHQRGLDDGEDVQHGAGEEAGCLEDLSPFDQDAVIAEVIVMDVPNHNSDMRDFHE